MSGVAAIRVEDIDQCSTPGAFEYFASAGRDIGGMIYNCPCGCGRQGSLRFRPRVNDGPSWEWDGNVDAPTLSPSVHDMPQGVTHWHGWLRGGVWESC